MKKLLLIIALVIVLVLGFGIYSLSNIGGLIKSQIELYGSDYLNTDVTVSSVDVAFSDGRLSINGLTISNPSGFSENNAFALQEVTLDLGNLSAEPYVVQMLKIDSPEVLYEVDAAGQGNLIVLKNNLLGKLPESSEQEPTPTQGTKPGPLVIVEDVVVSNVKLQLDFDKLDTSELGIDAALGKDIDTKKYEITLPTFSAGSVGKPDGIPAEQVGGEIVRIMLDNIIEQAKAEAKERAKDAAKEKLKEKFEENKDELKEKASEKLKSIFN